MEIFFTGVHSPETIRSLGRCRGALEAIFLSDITTAYGDTSKKMSLNRGARIQSQSSNSPANIHQTRIGTYGSASVTTLH
jgi:hypothetical protein